jgi:hypothetical protein
MGNFIIDKFLELKETITKVYKKSKKNRFFGFIIALLNVAK